MHFFSARTFFVNGEEDQNGTHKEKQKNEMSDAKSKCLFFLRRTGVVGDDNHDSRPGCLGAGCLFDEGTFSPPYEDSLSRNLR